MSARRPSRSPRNCRMRPTRAGLRGAVGSARRCRRPQEARSRLAGDREEAQRSRHFPLTGRSPRSGPRPPTRSARRSGCPAAWKAGSRSRRNSPPSNPHLSFRPVGIARRARNCIRPAIHVLKRDFTDGQHHRRDGQGAARADRRGHDGLQVGALGDRRRHGSRRSTCCARRASPRPPRRPAASRPRV